MVVAEAEPLRPTKAAAASGHVGALDGLRFLAFFGVFVFHALQNSPRLRPWAVYGALGVQVFFVLSGFLIGGILLQLREDSAVSLGARLKTFYVRRALRIFPLYYMFLLLLLLLPYVGITQIGGAEWFVWNATYLTNVKIYFDGGMGALSHFWSLAVEEHFYMLSPLVVLLSGTRGLSFGFVALWVACAAARVWFFVRGDTHAYVLSPMQFDCMTVGMAAAMIQAHGQFLGIGYERGLRIATSAAFAVVPLFALQHVESPFLQLPATALSQWVFAVAVAGLVLVIWNSKSRGLSRFLSLAPLPYLGKISYGLYVFHFPCLVLAYAWLSPIMSHGTAIPGLIMTLLVSMLSWHLFEGPINAQKRHFSYRRAR